MRKLDVAKLLSDALAWLVVAYLVCWLVVTLGLAVLVTIRACVGFGL